MTIKYTDGSLLSTVKAYDHMGLEHLQASLAYERLMREYHGAVSTMSSKFFPTPDAKSIETLLDSLSALIGVTSTKASDFKERRLELFAGAEVVCHLTKAFNASGLEELFIASRTDDGIEAVLAVFIACGYTLGSKSAVKGIVPVTFATPGTNGVVLTDRDFVGLKLASVATNYTTEVVTATEEMLATVRLADSGIVILNGDPGTGKSYLIRSILTELQERHAVICTPPATFLTNVDLLVEATKESNKPSLVVLEDIGDLLAQDNVSRHLDETSNFLNLTDGLLSLLMNTIFIVSFNHDMSKINPALTRPGRCLGQIAVSDLSPEQAKELVGPGLDGVFQMDRRYTLAEVYEMKRTGVALKHARRASVLPGMGRSS